MATPSVVNKDPIRGQPWSKMEALRGASPRQRRAASAWYGDSCAKLPHHTKDGRLHCKAVISAIAALNGARGGVCLPKKDCGAVGRHLTVHYRACFPGKKPPKIKCAVRTRCSGKC